MRPLERRPAAVTEDFDGEFKVLLHFVIKAKVVKILEYVIFL